MSAPPVERVPIAYPPEAVLTAAQVCAWLQISLRQLWRLNLPVVRLGKRTTRYHVGSVLDELKRREQR